MTFDFDDRVLLTPIDNEASQRVGRVRDLGIRDIPDAEFDAFAQTVAEKTDAPYAFVNFIDAERQFFAGLYTPDTGTADDPGADASGRTMPRDHGFCVHVVARQKAMALEDLRDFPRFHSNPVVDDLGFQSYLGAPLLDRDGMLVGTVAVTDVEPRQWGQAGVELIKALAAELMDLIYERKHRR